ncbi:MAG: hypothetical protein L6R28_07730 [Planctomycetes bacterium]|nr:hypothetical protein [Planctomycetota bacterium]
MNRILWTLLLAAGCTAAWAGQMEEFIIKREAVYEFAQAPKITRNGDHITIDFETKSNCDVTIAIEDEEGKILRHLACGVLGENAPPPFQKSSKKQTVVWDGKDDKGVYLDEKDRLTVRVSLGLDPRFQRTLYWSPHKRIANNASLMASAPEGVYVFEGQGLDHLRLFDHDGNYVRTVYPYPANKVGEVQGLQTRVFAQSGKELPEKLGFERATLLTSGSSAWGGEGGHEGGFGATAMAVHSSGGKTQIALGYHCINRLTADGDSGGLPTRGPEICYEVTGFERRQMKAGPTSMCFSPDGKYLYMTGFVWKTGNHAADDAKHAVLRMEYAKQDKPEIFAGQLDKHGSGNDLLCVPTSVDCDSAGRVYVADYANSRVQVFAPDGKYLKTIATRFPGTIKIEPMSGEIHVFSWPMIGANYEIVKDRKIAMKGDDSVVTCLGTFDKPLNGKPEHLPAVDANGSGGQISTGGQTYMCALDFHAKDPSLWLVGRKATVSVSEANWMGGGGIWSHLGGWMNRGIRIHHRKGGKWDISADFAKIAHEKVLRVDPAQFSRTRLLVNPANGDLYGIEEQTGAGKSFYSILKIDRDGGKITEVKLPFDAEDMIFDQDGNIYMKTDHEVVRFDSRTWREIAWDYGEERVKIGFASSGSLPRFDSIAALGLPGSRPVWFHGSGMWINAKQHLAVFCNIREMEEDRRDEGTSRYEGAGVTKKYTPHLYPGRSGSRIVAIFDKHGQVIHEDAVPGICNADGIGIDNDDALYIMTAAARLIDGKANPNFTTETLIKVRPAKAKVVSDGRAKVPLPDNLKPDGPAHFSKYGMGQSWVENAEWVYGGVGYGGQGGSCTCWHARFQLDYFARSFAPETEHYTVAVLDGNGNLITRIGRYGNVDDGKPLETDGGPANPRSIGGDEVSLSHAAYVGVHTDHDLYIHDAGNGRILRVKLGYHATEKVKLSSVKDPQ